VNELRRLEAELLLDPLRFENRCCATSPHAEPREPMKRVSRAFTVPETEHDEQHSSEAVIEAEVAPGALTTQSETTRIACTSVVPIALQFVAIRVLKS